MIDFGRLLYLVEYRLLNIGHKCNRLLELSNQLRRASTVMLRVLEFTARSTQEIRTPIVIGALWTSALLQVKSPSRFDVIADIARFLCSDKMHGPNLSAYRNVRSSMRRTQRRKFYVIIHYSLLRDHSTSMNAYQRVGTWVSFAKNTVQSPLLNNFRHARRNRCTRCRTIRDRFHSNYR